jgi:hypothetical protein
MPYDIFISYRRSTGANDARLLQQALKARGYEVFFDYDSLRDGQFDKRIFAAIDEAPVFVLMMTEGVLDQCAAEGDWVRTEIERAFERDRQIVPVRPSDQTCSFPTNLPRALDRLRCVQRSTMNKEDLFEQSIDKIVEDRFPAKLKRSCLRATNPSVAMANVVHRVECPICGDKNREERTFRCLRCGRDGICLRHRRHLNGYCCCECAKKEKEDRRKAKDAQKEQRKAERAERKNQRREKRARRRAGKKTAPRSEDANDR